MLTKVRLDGVMGKKFGQEWDLEVSSPAEALRLIEANRPGLQRWISENQETYSLYRVTVVYDDDREEDLDDDGYGLVRTVREIRFSPQVAGASGIVKAVVGVVLIVASFFVPAVLSPYLFKIGVALTIGGVVEMLSPRPKRADGNFEAIASNYFDGPVNTERQGNPVPLIYGRVLIGSHPVSAAVTVDEVAV